MHQDLFQAANDWFFMAALDNILHRLPLNQAFSSSSKVQSLRRLDNAVALKAPGGVVCLISAPAFHEITTQIPHVVHLAMQRGAEPPRLTHPPIRIYWFKGKAFSEGIEIHKVDGFQVRIYNAEKSVADYFKYRNKIGLDVAIEALRLCWQRKRTTVDKLMHFARICRVEKVMRPYLEAIL